MGSKAGVKYSYIKGQVSYAYITGEAAYQLANGMVSYQNVTATEIILDPNSLNQYLSNEFSFADLISLRPEKTTLDELGFTDEQATALAKGVTDSVTFSDSVFILITIARGFSDSLSVSDFSAIALSKDVTETISLTHSRNIDFAKVQFDGVILSDIQSRLISKTANDSASMSDSFGRIATFARSFTDAFGLDELVNVSPNWGVEKTNIFSFTESFSYEIRAGHNSVLNASALNTYTLNS